MYVIKSSGVTQEFAPEKIKSVINWAVRDGLQVNEDELYDKLQPFLYDGIRTKEIQSALIKVAADNISLDTPDYQYVAANLVMFELRKAVYNKFDPDSLGSIIKAGVQDGIYTDELLQFSKEEIAYLDSRIDHSRDFTFTYSGAMQLKEKYLVKNRVSGQLYETPQIAFMLIGMCLHLNESNRLSKIDKFYDMVSSKIISLPTPIMAGVRTPIKQFSSCVVIESGDSLESINKTASSIIKYISKRAGIGINAGMIRAEGSKVGPGEVKHTGVIPFYKHFQTAVKSCLTPDTIVEILD